MKQYIPIKDALNARNSKVVGVSINRDGNITQIRARLDFPASQPNRILVASSVQLNPIRIEPASQIC